MIITLLALVGATALALGFFTIILLAFVVVRDTFRDRKARRDERERRKRAYDRLIADIKLAGPAVGTWFPEAKHPLDSKGYDLVALTLAEPEKPFSVDYIRKMN